MNTLLASHVTTRRVSRFVPLSLVALLLVGCEVPQAADQTAEGGPPEPVYGDAQPDGDDAATSPEAGEAQPGGGDAQPAAGDAQPAAGDAQPAAGDNAAAGSPDASGGGNLVEAKAGVSGKGNYGPGFITTPISTYFTLRERVAFRHLQSELKNYVAAKGKPKDFAEVETKVIKPAAIQLPELPPGDRYVYLPDKGPWGEVMVLKKGAAKE